VLYKGVGEHNVAGSQALAIVVGVELSEVGEVAFDAAVELGASRGSVPVHVVHVIAGYDPLRMMEYASATDQIDLSQEKRQLNDFIQEALDRWRRKGHEPKVIIIPHVLVGPPAKEIMRVAHSVSADLVVVGTHGRTGVKRLLVGSVAEEIMRLAACPVLVMRHKDWSTVSR
jgi:nucleotide-binding universal stress UspA family protein